MKSKEADGDDNPEEKTRNEDTDGGDWRWQEEEKEMMLKMAILKRREKSLRREVKEMNSSGPDFLCFITISI